MKIPFNMPPFIGPEEKFVSQALHARKMSGDGDFSKRCQTWFEDRLAPSKALLTPSCTQALEMAAILLDIKDGDEVIMPSFTFVSTANAFVLRGAKVVFVDVEPSTMNVDVTQIEAAITEKTKAVVPVHYAGVCCDMDRLLKLAVQYDLSIVEDAAQAMMSTYKGKPLGTFGHLGAYSFHETKNYTSGGEGGLLLINDRKYFERAEIIREKGTDRSKFFRGAVDKYSWKDIGSSFLPSELQAAYLWGQLLSVNVILERRLQIWNMYRSGLEDLVHKGRIEIQSIPEECSHNAHMFYLKCRDLSERSAFIKFMAQSHVMAVFHYVPLHSSMAGERYGRFEGVDHYTTRDSERLVRLPLYFNMTNEDVNRVLTSVKHFFG
jgi:dTDP-4-amino-4,6-dideoxygalactose transaminase